MDTKVIEAITQLNNHEKAALATVIATKGSTPRKSGAQILFFSNGYSIGTIGGGCGESEVHLQAMNVIQSGIPQIVHVNLTHEIAESDGMVCGGTMDVFVERIKTEMD